MTDPIAILTVAFREERFIRANVEQFAESGLRHLVLVSATPWHGDWQSDSTMAVAAGTRAEVIAGFWTSEADQRNYGLERLAAEGVRWALVVDADEFYTPEGIEQIRRSIHSAMVLRWVTHALTAPAMTVYWKREDYRIVPEQHDNPIVAIQTSQRFTHGRQAAGATARRPTEAELHHFSYVRSDTEMRAKIESFEHQHEIRADWYEDVWLAWTPESRNLHPVVPSQFGQAVWDPAPVEIRRLFEPSCYRCGAQDGRTRLGGLVCLDCHHPR